GGTDDDRPSYTINDVTRNEGAGTMTFTVTLTGDTALASTGDYTTADNTATAGADYTATSGTLSFAAGLGTRTQAVTVSITNANISEQSETYFVNLSGVVYATGSHAERLSFPTRRSSDLGGTDDDRPSYTINDVTRNEGAGTMTFTVTLTGDRSEECRVGYARGDNTATAEGDNTAASGTLGFAGGRGAHTQRWTAPRTNDSA